MSSDLAMRCACGSLRGVIHDATPGRVNRVVCCCGSCQRYAHELGRAEQILDEHGGTHVFQTSPAFLELTDGAEHLAVLQLTDGGALRWYAGCCDSPIANTLATRGTPFMAVHETFVDRDAVSAPLDERLGPVRVRVNGDFPRPLARELRATKWALLAMLSRYVFMIGWWRLRGDHRRSPFFDAASGRPVLAPPR